MDDFMTTLIITDTGFYSDGRTCCRDEIIKEDFPKAFAYKGRAVAITGDVVDLKYMAMAYIDGEPLDEFIKVDGTAFIHHNGITRSVGMEDEALRTYRHEGTDCMGSGAYFAKAALDFGKTPEEAIRYAMTRDCATGGEIFSVLFEDLEK
jgi:hypothetical protein